MQRLRHEADRATSPAGQDGSAAGRVHGAGFVSAAPRPEADGASRTSVSPQLLHDLRSPLNHIIGYSEMLTEEAEGQRREGFATDLEKIRTAGHRMLALIEENFTSARETIPVLIARESEPAVQSDFSPQTEGGLPGLLLVVDDDAANREVLSRRLVRQGHEVQTASSGLEAMRILGDAAFDLVLLDIMMPE